MSIPLIVPELTWNSIGSGSVIIADPTNFNGPDICRPFIFNNSLFIISLDYLSASVPDYFFWCMQIKKDGSWCVFYNSDFSVGPKSVNFGNQFLNIFQWSNTEIAIVQFGRIYVFDTSGFLNGQYVQKDLTFFDSVVSACAAGETGYFINPIFGDKNGILSFDGFNFHSVGSGYISIYDIVSKSKTAFGYDCDLSNNPLNNTFGIYKNLQTVFGNTGASFNSGYLINQNSFSYSTENNQWFTGNFNYDLLTDGLACNNIVENTSSVNALYSGKFNASDILPAIDYNPSGTMQNNIAFENSPSNVVGLSGYQNQPQLTILSSKLALQDQSNIISFAAAGVFADGTVLAVGKDQYGNNNAGAAVYTTQIPLEYIDKIFGIVITPLLALTKRYNLINNARPIPTIFGKFTT